MKQDPTLASDVAAEQGDVEVVHLPGEQGPPTDPTNGNAVRAIVTRVDAVFALSDSRTLACRFRRSAVARGPLSKIDARLGYRGTAGGNRRDILQVKDRQAFTGLLHRGHDRATVGEQEMQVDPGLGVG